ncbi:MAG: hypothetical protein Q7T12_04020 [Flavobacterium sp.]|nr:hypothetical protein [Flavobacterium sp.]
MKIIILLLVICCYSCKENKYEYDNEIAVDSAATAVDQFVADSVAMSSEIIEEPIKELTFEEVMQTTSIHDLENFIEKNPDHENIEKLKARVIDLEVDQIFSDKNTGKMPNSDKVGESNSGISEVSIKNDTSCELIVRYSGIDSRMISIPQNQLRSISIKSGDYRVTATACGESYSSTEDLSGNYSSSYYISRTFR